jgi:hypothetical protein
MINDGIEIEYPPEFKWDKEMVNKKDFVQKLNTSNVGMMHESLSRLVKKKSTKKLKEGKESSEERKYLDQNIGNVKFQ